MKNRTRIVFSAIAVGVMASLFMFTHSGQLATIPAQAPMVRHAATPPPTASPAPADVPAITPVNLLAQQPLHGSPVISGAANPQRREVAGQLARILASPPAATPAVVPAMAPPQQVPPREAVQRRAALTRAQERDLGILQWSSGKSLQARMHPENGAPRYLRGRPLVPATTLNPPRPVEAAKTFVSRFSDLLRLDNAPGELAVARAERDDLGYTVVRFNQTYQGFKVWPAELLVQANDRGDVIPLCSSHIPTPTGLDTTPNVNPAAARATARAATAKASKREPATLADLPVADQQLVVHADEHGTAALAWRIRIRPTPVECWVTVVDAKDGNSIRCYNEVPTGRVSGSGSDATAATRALSLWQDGSLYYLCDTSKSIYDPTSTPPSPATTRGAIIVSTFNGASLPDTQGEPMPQANLVASTSPTAAFPGHAVGAAFIFGKAYDYYKQVHNRQGLENAAMNIRVVVDVGQWPNACWAPDLQSFFFGIIQPNGQPERYSSATDIAAHEYTHAVTSFTADLYYADQSGAMNESFSDFFGESVEAFVTGSGPDWLIGTNLNMGPSRNMIDPHQFDQPARFSEFLSRDEVIAKYGQADNGGVHINSGITNHAFQLIANKTTLEKAGRILYRALSTKLNARSQFIDCRLACVQCAQELFGESAAEVTAVREAFDAVEIFDQSGTPDPTPLPTSPGADCALFTSPYLGYDYMGRYEAAKGDPTLGRFIGTRPVHPSKRPCVTGDGTMGVYVTLNYDVGFIDTATGTEQSLGINYANSVAVSGDGTTYAFVFLDSYGTPDNRISVYDSRTSGFTDYALLAPSMDGGNTATVLYADSLALTADGRFLFYDALNRITFAQGYTMEVWSLYAIDRANGATYIVVPPFTGYNIGNPSLGHSLTNLIAFEVSSTTTGTSAVYVMDLQSGNGGYVVSGVSNTYGFAMPSFNGDDTRVMFSKHTSGTIALQPLGSNHISPSGAPWDAFYGDAGSIYRRGTYGGLPVLNVAAVKDRCRKGVDSGAFSINRSGSQSASTNFSILLTGSAANGSDFQTIPLTGSVPAGVPGITIYVVPKDSMTTGPTKDVTMRLSDNMSYAIGTPNATVFIDDANTFASWATLKGVSGMLTDSDRDGFNNLLEYGLGTEPMSPLSRALPLTRITKVGQQRYLTYEVPRTRIAPDVVYRVQFASALSGTSAPWSETGVELENTATRLVVRDSVPISAANPKRFARLRITAP